MKLTPVTTLSVCALATACRPDVGPPISQINGPTILAVRSVPAEVDPTTRTPVAFEALAVDASGRVPGPGTDIADPLWWSICDKPKPPTENNAVSSSCLDANALPGALGPSATTFVAPMSSDACTLFGPSIHPIEGQPPIRPRDPDVTGGYYQPVRAELVVPEALRRSGMTTVDSVTAFHLQRIQCGLANVPGDAGREYAQNYKLNNNPTLTALRVASPGADPVEMPATMNGGAVFPGVAGQALSIEAHWSEDSVEYYPAWDVIARKLAYHHEAMRVSWYATGGTFEHDVTGRGENESDRFAPNTWKSNAAGTFHIWLVLHDSRGGTDFAALDVVVQ